MLAIRGYYDHGHIELMEPIPNSVSSAELHIVVIPKDENAEHFIPADEFHKTRHDGERDFKALGLSAFFDTDDDAEVDWEEYFGVR